MPRIARAVAGGYPHHVIQRGNNRADVFSDSEDREQYLSLLKKYSEKWQTPVLAYCLMSKHIHLLVKPASETSLYKMMQVLTLCYTQYYNRKCGMTGRPFGGDEFVQGIEKKLKRPLAMRPRGRPKKNIV